jgi:hypothetical protein
VSRPKNGKNSTKNGKNGKNPLLQTKILKLLHGPILTIWAQTFFTVQPSFGTFITELLALR